ncbi:MAG: hypothetical protein G01um101417_167 [Parcubacteria group bacterium Gr01-1014_17]|nr:MAG: hypothetical protein G01um101417_167 [Parcubacteria group bacterium Gr01-1014_17]
MLDFNPKKCLCAVTDCGKCLTLGCTDDDCTNHHIITKWRYRKRALESLLNEAEKLRGDNKNGKQPTSLRMDIKSYEEEIEKLDKVMGVKIYLH